MPWLQAKDVTTDPVEGEVRSAVAAYKMALVMSCVALSVSMSFMQTWRTDRSKGKYLCCQFNRPHVTYAYVL